MVSIMIKIIIQNFFLYSFSFFASLFMHRGTILLNEKYDKYYAAFIISWLISSIASRKYKAWNEVSLLSRLYTYTISFFLMLGILALIIYKFNLIEISRFIVLYSVMLAYLCEINSLIYKNKDKVKLKFIRLTYSIKAFTFEVVLFGIVNIYLIYNLAGNISFNFNNIILFIILYLSWFVGSFIGHRFHPSFRRRGYWPFIWQYIKAYTIIFALASFSAFINRLELFEIIIIYYGIITYSILSFIGSSYYYYIKKYRILTLNVSGFPVKGEFGDILLDEKIPNTRNYYKSSFNALGSNLLNNNLKNLSLKNYPDVFEFLDERIDLNSFDNSCSMILKSYNISNIDFLPDESLQLLINIQEINKVRNINEYLSEVNNKLMVGSIYCGNFETVYLRHQRYLKAYPYYFAQLFYFLDFLWNRIFSKMFLLNNIYSILMGGTHKSLSLAEGLGRLYYSGFEVIHLKIIENNMFFITKKIKEPIKDMIPSTGLIFKMKRIGKNGKPINVYKLRTMHPYAEYLQEFIYNRFNLQEGGKFKNDFRITYWGSILRRLWIDELPMLYNWLKGDLKLVGFRPLSIHYLNLYKEELRQKRLKFKPGLIPPFYADMPRTFNEIMKSEEKYLFLYEKNRVLTDIIYFIKCTYNILFKRVRSS